MSFDVIIPFLAPIRNLLQSETISEVMVNPDGTIWCEEAGLVRPMPGLAFEADALRTGLEVIANRFGKKLGPNAPILNLRLPDGSRLAAMIPPLVHPDPLLTIRKFTARGFTLVDLIAAGMLTEAQAATLTAAVRTGKNLLIAGATSTGKTTLAGVLADAIPEHERILLIEDTAELHIRKPHVISLEAQQDTHRGAVTFDDLLKAVLRHRPDRILVGEVRGPEARTLLDALNTGHRGMLATIHASGAREAVHRLANLAMRASHGLSLDAVREEAQRGLDLVVHLHRDRERQCIREILDLVSPSGSDPAHL